MPDSPSSPSGSPPGKPLPAPLAELETRYRQHLVDQFSRLTFQGVAPSANGVSLPLVSVYVELKAIADVPDSADTFTPEERQAIERLRDAGDSDPWLRPLERWQRQGRDEDGHEGRRPTGERRGLPAGLLSWTGPGLVLLGDPGSGKTTLLHYLALMAASRTAPGAGQIGLAAAMLGPTVDEHRLPIFVPLAAYDDHLRREQGSAELYDFLAVYYERWRSLPGLGPLFAAAFEAGRALVLLDGLDEVIDRGSRDRVTQQVAALIKRHGGRGNRFVVTGRVVGYREAPLPGDIPHATVLDFGPAEVAQFVHKWCLAYESFVHGGASEPAALSAATEERALLDDVRSNVSVAALARNPLLLTMLALLRRQVGKLPQRRVELYERYLDALLRSRVDLRSPGARAHGAARYDVHQATLVLIELSLWLHQNCPSGTARRIELLQALTQIHLDLEGVAPHEATAKQRLAAEQDSERFLHDLRHLTGILAERGRDAFGFLHLTFQEFFVGRALARRSPGERWQLLRPHLHDPRWREPLLLCAGWLGVQEGRTNEVDALARQLRDSHSEHEPLLHRDLFLAAALVVDDVGVSRRFQDELSTLIAERCDDRVPSIRRQAVAATVHLASNGHEPSRRRVEAWLHPEQRPRRVIEALKGWSCTRLAGEDPVLVPLALGKLDDADSEVRAAAAHALGVVAAGAAVLPLLLARLDDPKARVRAAVATALTPVAATVCEPLVRHLEDADSGVRAAAVRALAALAAGPTVGPALLRRCEDAMPAVRAAAVHALALTAAAAPVQAELLRRLGDTSWRVREAAVDALATVAAVAPVQQALLYRLSDAEPLVRAAAVKALRSVAARPVVQSAIVHALADNYPWVRTTAADALAAEVGAPPIQQALLRVLNDENSQVRGAAARGLLAAAGLAGVQVAFIHVLDDPEPGVRLAAARGFLTHRDASLRGRAVEVVRAALRAQDRWARLNAIAVLTQIELGEAASDAIRDLLHLVQQDPDEAVRDAAYQAVYRLLLTTTSHPRPA
jgi:HEAT repeat protein